MIDFLRNFDTLSKEIQTLRQKMIVFFTKRRYDVFLKESLRSLGTIMIDPVSENFSLVHGLPDFVKLAVRTPHFRRVDLQQLAEVAEKIDHVRRRT